MMVKNSHKALFLLAFIVILMIIYVKNRDTSNKDTDTCQLHAQKCTILVAEGPFQVQIIDQLVVEELIGVQISLPSSLKIEQIYIEGINMYMGKSQVQQLSVNSHAMNSTQHLWNGEFFLGSCSLETMHWQMVIELAGKEQVIKVPFTTYL